MHERATVFALRNLHPAHLPAWAMPGTLTYEHFHGGNFSIYIEPQPVSHLPILWATRCFDGLPAQRTAEIAHAAEAIYDHCGEMADLLMAYGDCTRSNRLSCIRAHGRQLNSMAVRSIVFFDMHRSDIANFLGKRAMQLPTMEFWANYAAELNPPVGAVISPDLGRRFAAESLAQMLRLNALSSINANQAPKSLRQSVANAF